MKKKIRIVIALTVIISLFNIIGLNCYANSQVKNLSQKEQQGKEQDIVDIASSDSRFKTLVTALNAAGLVDTLKGKGPFTVFAPTDEAFAKLPKGIVESLLKPENKDTLVKILTYHVAPEKLTAAEVVKLNGKELKMVNGDKAKIEVKNNEVYIDGAKVIVTDIIAKNGVIHVIDTVMTK
ncbi:Uncaracterized surface protein containing fasciclin (FAS1) repeats [Clostridium cavendishii DSM 21758]|uniref:Uncaracterized surface protein containing fasciclin (FAS1) repeats n=1 Tax=Clostridium cavendishii DSM 21758 TaxID=1121302 RepID=A0A1M6HPJ4_9CLOT|nr:fasciclin domain-containing protein [Clostridium cavendishii]SHJ24112.1 Uncaracterized surface protein containing fasciclin (FAS1) repeats [Clostridium cavendishii DSM 21758]